MKIEMARATEVSTQLGEGLRAASTGEYSDAKVREIKAAQKADK